MILLAFLASGFALFLGGFLVGLYVNRGIRRIPEHPSLHVPRPTRPDPGLPERKGTAPPQFRVVPPAPPGQADPLLMSTDTSGSEPYDWKRADEQ